MENITNKFLPILYQFFLIIGPVALLLGFTFGMFVGTKKQNWQPLSIGLIIGSASIIIAYYLNRTSQIRLQFDTVELIKQIAIVFVVVLIFNIVHYVSNRD